jgi:MauM/NapG family ferredoxin protein
MRNERDPATSHRTPSRQPLRPPGAVPEPEFVRRCIKCNKCAQVCPYRSVHMARLDAGTRAGTPMIFARDNPCYLCMKCPPVCPTGALNPKLTELREVRMGVAVINRDSCLAYQGIICRSCFERCPLYREAITLRDEHYPEVNESLCTGCGICENVCPTDDVAIRIRSAHAPPPRRATHRLTGPLSRRGFLGLVGG